jgi:death on curing protein
MREPRWVPRQAVEAVHLDQIRTHGGVPGLRDEGLLESALARPRNKWTYRRKSSLALLAAAYVFALVKDHPFHDGNKRVAFLTGVMFLGLNGYQLVAEESDVVTAMLGLASGRASEADMARWIRKRIVRVQS